ncbi:MAG: hypothetical protein ACYDHO_01535 [Gaiellaceae bacterium]
MIRLRFLLPAVFVLIVLALPASASALIVPQRSIAGAKLGMTRAQAEARLGAPNRVRTRKSESFGFTWRDLVYGRVTVSVFLPSNGSRVFALTTKSKLERTTTGVGIGSTLAQVKAGLKGETCRREFGIHHCWLGGWKAGKAVTDFLLAHRRVSKITISYVFD